MMIEGGRAAGSGLALHHHNQKMNQATESSSRLVEIVVEGSRSSLYFRLTSKYNYTKLDLSYQALL